MGVTFTNAVTSCEDKLSERGDSAEDDVGRLVEHNALVWPLKDG